MAGNLSAMLEKTTANSRSSGFLFIKLDGFDKLEERFGEEGREVLFKKFSSVIIRAVREADLVCRYDADTLCVLFPSLEENEGPLLTHSVRKSLLNYQFRLAESGPTVILNAHFGYTDCLPHENDDLVLNRAGNALDKSQSRGKNQIHAHDGDQMRELRRSHYTP
jgi:diguanylate cyclase (GGDEF)-like protein